MFPYADYFHVLTVYLIIGLVLWLPPLILPQWKSLVKFLNKKKTRHKIALEVILFSLSAGIIITSICLISVFNDNIIRLQFDDIADEANFFTLFAGFTFLLMPFAMGIIAATTYVHNRTTFKLGNFFVLLVAFCALAMAGSFYHDVLWCGTATDWYTKVNLGGYDFDLWTIIVGVTNRDYQLLGISQGTLAIFLIIFAIILLWKFDSMQDAKFTWKNRLKLIITSFFSVVFFGFFLFIIDAAWVADFNITAHILYLGFPLIALIFYLLGKSILPEPKKNENRENK